jgi:hypothetical protein
MTAFHHAIFSLDFGSFDNVEVVRLLLAAKANHVIKDVKGELPKDCALMRGAMRIAALLSSLCVSCTGKCDDEDEEEKPHISFFVVMRKSRKTGC